MFDFPEKMKENWHEKGERGKIENLRDWVMENEIDN
jgi:hypothetical protein